MAAARSRAFTDALGGVNRMRRLSDVAMVQTLLASFDAMVAQEQAEGATVREGGTAWRGFVTHVGMVLDESRNRAATILTAALGIRALPVAYGVFESGAFGWQAVEAVVRHAGSLTGDARDRYDLEAARIATELVPQLLDAALSRLHDTLDHTAATEQGARAIRMRGVRARPGEHGTAELVIRGPEFDIAAI